MVTRRSLETPFDPETHSNGRKSAGAPLTESSGLCPPPHRRRVSAKMQPAPHPCIRHHRPHLPISLHSNHWCHCVRTFCADFCVSAHIAGQGLSTMIAATIRLQNPRRISGNRDYQSVISLGSRIIEKINTPSPPETATIRLQNPSRISGSRDYQSVIQAATDIIDKNNTPPSPSALLRRRDRCANVCSFPA